MSFEQIRKTWFDDKQVRVIGSLDAPLFVVADICNELGLGGNMRNTIAEYDDPTERMSIIGIDGSKNTFTVLTEDGLIRFLLDSTSKKVKLYRDRCIKHLRSRRSIIETKTTLSSTSATEQTKIINDMQDVTSESSSSDDTPTTDVDKVPNNTSPKPTTVATSTSSGPLVINNIPHPDWVYNIHGECLYLVQIEGTNDHKYGITNDIIVRLTIHKKEYGSKLIVIKVLRCYNRKAATDAETWLKRKYDGCKLHPKYNKTEMFTADDNEPFCHDMDAYVAEANADHERRANVQSESFIKAETKRIKATTALKRVELEAAQHNTPGLSVMMAENKRLELQLELKKTDAQNLLLASQLPATHASTAKKQRITNNPTTGSGQSNVNEPNEGDRSPTNNQPTQPAVDQQRTSANTTQDEPTPTTPTNDSSTPVVDASAWLGSATKMQIKSDYYTVRYRDYTIMVYKDVYVNCSKLGREINTDRSPGKWMIMKEIKKRFTQSTIPLWLDQMKDPCMDVRGRYLHYTQLDEYIEWAEIITDKTKSPIKTK